MTQKLDYLEHSSDNIQFIFNIPDNIIDFICTTTDLTGITVGSIAAEVPVKFQIDRIIVISLMILWMNHSIGI